MNNIAENLQQVLGELPAGVRLVAVSKFHPNEAIEEAYRAGQRVFGESRVQEMTAKYESLPKDIEWHFIGHLQTNKIKFILPYVALIHGIDSYKLLVEVNKQAAKIGKVVNCLLHRRGREQIRFQFRRVSRDVGLRRVAGAEQHTAMWLDGNGDKHRRPRTN